MYAVATAPYVCSASLISDVDDDCDADFADYAKWQPAGDRPAPIDLVVDGHLDFLDIEQFASDWLSCTRATPEPCWQ